MDTPIRPPESNATSRCRHPIGALGAHSPFREPRHNRRDERQGRQDIGEEPDAPDFPESGCAPVIEPDESSVDKRGEEWADEAAKQTEENNVARVIEARRSADKIAETCRADECLARVADEIAEHHRQRDLALRLREQMCRQRCEEQKEPGARRSEQKSGEQNGVRRPQHRNGVGLERQDKAELRTKIIAEADKKSGTPRLTMQQKNSFALIWCGVARGALRNSGGARTEG